MRTLSRIRASTLILVPVPVDLVVSWEPSVTKLLGQSLCSSARFIHWAGRGSMGWILAGHVTGVSDARRTGENDRSGGGQGGKAHGHRRRSLAILSRAYALGSPRDAQQRIVRAVGNCRWAQRETLPLFAFGNGPLYLQWAAHQRIQAPWAIVFTSPPRALGSWASRVAVAGEVVEQPWRTGRSRTSLWATPNIHGGCAIA